MTWRIHSWDRARGRGAIASAQLGPLEFDAAVALAGDFVVGEIVHVELAPVATAARFVVTKLWPDDPRFIAPAGARAAPALAAEIAARVERALAAIPSALDYRIARAAGGDVVVEGDNDLFAYGHLVRIDFRAIEYVDLPTLWAAKSLRLADAAERAYLATRTEITDATVAIRIVDDDLRIYFVACADVDVVVTPSRSGASGA